MEKLTDICGYFGCEVSDEAGISELKGVAKKADMTQFCYKFFKMIAAQTNRRERRKSLLQFLDEYKNHGNEPESDMDPRVKNRVALTMQLQ